MWPVGPCTSAAKWERAEIATGKYFLVPQLPLIVVVWVHFPFEYESGLNVPLPHVLLSTCTSIGVVTRSCPSPVLALQCAHALSRLPPLQAMSPVAATLLLNMPAEVGDFSHVDAFTLGQ